MKTMIKRSMFPSLLDEFFNDSLLKTERFPIRKELIKFSSPAINVKETDVAYQIELAAPGMKKEDFSIELDDHLLTLSTEKKASQEISEENYSRKEFGYYQFKRSFSLPEDQVHIEGISAQYEDGVLYVRIPKKTKEEQASAVKRIEIG